MTATHAMQVFISNLNSDEGKEKTAQDLETFIRDKLRENAFSRKILTPKNVTRNTPGVQVSTNHDTLIYIDEIEPNSRAMTLTFRGEPKARYIRADRYEIPFHMIASEKFEKTEEELLAYRMPLTKVIEDNSVLDIQEIEDYRFIVHAEAAVQATGKITRGEQAQADAAANGPGAGLRGKVQKDDLVDLLNLLDNSRRVTDKILMNSEDANNLIRWTIEDYGDEKQGKITIDGYTYDKIVGKKLVRTVKTDILQSGNIYAFTDAKWLGRFLVLNNTKFWIDKKFNLIQWIAWETIAMSFANVASIAKLETYNGQGGLVNTSDALIDEDEVGTQVFNQASLGVTFPNVVQY